MSATSRGIIPGTRTARETDTGIVYQMTYRVQTTDKNDGAATVRTAFGLPRIGNVYQSGNDYDPDAICTNVDPREGEAWDEWEVDVVFDTNPSRTSAGGGEDNPLNRAPVFEYATRSRRVKLAGFYTSPGAPPAGKTYDGKLLMPNGEPFDPQPEVDIDEPVLTIRKNVQGLNPFDVLSLANAVNNGPFLGAEARQLKIESPRATERFHNAVGVYLEIQYSLAFRFETWDVQQPNVGTYYVTGDPPTSSDFIFFPDRANPTPVSLTSSGGKLAFGNAPTYSRFAVWRELNFHTLGLI